MRDHGGNIGQAAARFGGAPRDWIDLSTGINRLPYPVPSLPATAWTDLPHAEATEALLAAAAAAYATAAAILPLAGAQAAIQILPRLDSPGRARILTPTYNEYAPALEQAGWRVEPVETANALEGADLAVIVNPNNPDGRTIAPGHLLTLATRVGRLVVDESFADPQPSISLAPMAGRAGTIVLRSFGKFYGLAGLRLGFALGARDDIAALGAMAGPWPVAGAALEIGRVALGDRDWAERTRARLRAGAARLDSLAATAGWQCAGGTDLFRLYETGAAAAAQERLARHGIWSRVFPYSDGWLRLGLPGAPSEWSRLQAALG